MIVLALLLRNHFVPYGRMGLKEGLEALALLVSLYVYSYAWFWLTERKYYAFRAFVRGKVASLRRLVASSA